MSEQPAAGRDVLAELDSIRDYLLGLCGDGSQPGLDSNKQRLPGTMLALRELAQNTVELAAEYAAGGTFMQRLAKSYGRPLDFEQVRHLLPGEPAADEVARLREENAQLLARMGGQA